MDTSSPNTDPPIWKAFVGGGFATGFGAALYALLGFLLEKLPPVDAGASLMVRNIGTLVRYVMVGSLSLMTFMCGMIGLGLVAYGGQLLWLKLRPPANS